MKIILKASFGAALTLFNFCSGFGQNQAPVITNLTANIDWQLKVMNIRFDVSDAESDPLEITFKVSDNGGKTFFHSTQVTTGDVGFPISGGPSKQIIWDYNDTLVDFAQFLILVEANDRQPVNIQSIVDQVDSTRLYQTVSFLEGIRHNSTGAAHLQASRDSLNHRFNRYGLYPWVQNFSFGVIAGQNIVAKTPGMENESETYVIDAHYDGVSNGPAADDNASGVAGVLEAARILSQYSFDRSIKFIGFDLEEAGLVGSNRYVNQNGILAGQNIAGVLNFEMIGYFSQKPNSQSVPPGFAVLFPAAYAQVQADSFRGNFITSAGNTNSDSLNNVFVNSAQQYVPALKVAELTVPGTGTIAPDLRRSDHASFWDGNFKALLLTDGADSRNLNYHTPNDVKDSLNFTFMANVVKASVATLATLAGPRHSSVEVTGIANLTSIEERKWECHPLVSSVKNNSSLLINFDECPPAALSIEVINQRGQTVFRQADVEIDKKAEIDLGQMLVHGVYLVTLTNENNKWSAQKIMVK